MCSLPVPWHGGKQESVPQLDNASQSGHGAADDDQLTLAETFIPHDSSSSTEVGQLSTEHY